MQRLKYTSNHNLQKPQYEKIAYYSYCFALTIAECTKSQRVRTLAVKANGKIMGGIGCTGG